MIYTVTFNPAIDYACGWTRRSEVGEVNRAKGEDCVLGGKGSQRVPVCWPSWAAGTRRWACGR